MFNPITSGSFSNLMFVNPWTHIGTHYVWWSLLFCYHTFSSYQGNKL